MIVKKKKNQRNIIKEEDMVKMNTKQLWNALIKNKVTEPFFDGIFPRDMVTIIENQPKLIICNTDPSFKKGEHWVLFYFDKNVAEFYDPLGKNIIFYGSEFSDLVSKFANKYKFSKVRTQPIKSNLCGEYCLYYAYGWCKGYSMEYIVESMSSSRKVVKFVNNHYCICTNTACNLLQYCEKK